MFEARAENALSLKKVMHAISHVLDDGGNFDEMNSFPGVVECTTRGIQLQATNASRICLAVVFLDARGFDYYRCQHEYTDGGDNQEHSYLAGINMADLVKVFEFARNDDRVELTLLDQNNNEDDRYALKVSFMGSNGQTSSEFLLARHAEGYRYLIPATSYDRVIRMVATEFLRNVGILSRFGINVTIEWNHTMLSFTSRGTNGTSHISVIPDPVEVNVVSSSHKEFGLRCLTQFANSGITLGKTVTFSLSNENVPLLVEYRIEREDEDDVANDLGYVQYYLAPLVSEDLNGNMEA